METQPESAPALCQSTRPHFLLLKLRWREGKQRCRTNTAPGSRVSSFPQSLNPFLILVISNTNNLIKLVWMKLLWMLINYYCISLSSHILKTITSSCCFHRLALKCYRLTAVAQFIYTATNQASLRRLLHLAQVRICTRGISQTLQIQRTFFFFLTKSIICSHTY